jgi:hypothetical protein
VDNSLYGRPNMENRSIFLRNCDGNPFLIGLWITDNAQSIVSLTQEPTPMEVMDSEMRKSDVTCPKCNAGYRRVELMSRAGKTGEFRCLACNHLLEVFDGSHEVAIRLTVQPANRRNQSPRRFNFA